MRPEGSYQASITRTRPATLWIGGALSPLEQLCLTSFVRQGMEPVVFSYDGLEFVPDGVEQRDASEVLPRDRIYRAAERNSLAPFADGFRYHMLEKTDFFWVDADVFARRPFRFRDDFLAAWAPPVVNVSVLSLPKGSPVLARLTEAFDAPSSDNMPWLAARGMDFSEFSDLAGKIDAARLPYKAFGPWALTWLLKRSPHHENVLAPETHNPIYPRHVLQRWRKIARRIKASRATSVHLFGSVQHERIRSAFSGRVDADSYLGRLLAAHELPLEFL